ncbi:hypothetical protein ADK70_10185 [Streptomyces rimosus subsp. pseudoverticillatus]|uniref:hypothetical protein n=1 Tax=Streptomyces rimosus TaxID=1927 RepID=UPI0006B261C4|nr:hypothetical protein [Streptomyces rimosus]KOT95942.1 hypothetical protein ADK70_10185 [Streptomyces rimosus subsp. pseudoverticillatus]
MGCRSNGTVPTNCPIQVEIWDNANHRFNSAFKDGNSCARGRHPVGGSRCESNWDPAGYGSRVTVHAYFRLYSGNRQVNDTSTHSPSIAVSYTGVAHCRATGASVIQRCPDAVTASAGTSLATVGAEIGCR